MLLLILKDIMGSFCKKTYFFPPLSPLSCTNALRQDCPLRQFREQQNSSENSESAEGTESTEETESAEDPECSEHSDNSEMTAFPVACQVGQAFLPALLGARRSSPVYVRGWSPPHQRAGGRATAFFSLVYIGQG